MAYITRSHLYRDLIALLPDIGAQLTRSERLRLKMYGRIRSWSNDRITWPVRLPVNRLWPDHPIADTAIPAAFILLEESDSEQLELEYVAPQDVPVGDLIEMNFSEARHFLNLIRKNQALSNFASWLVEWQQNEQALLEERTKEIPVYLLKRPGDVRTLSSFQDALMEKMVDLVQQKDTNYLP